MRLLDKKVISSDFQVQKKLQIDEGVAIAKKVDVLRETLTSLEGQHKKFIEGIRQDLINQTKALEERKSAVLGEIYNLEERRKELLRPLDDKWSELTEAQTKFKQDLQGFHDKQDELKLKEKEIEKTTKQIEKAKVIALNHESETSSLNQEAMEDRRLAKILKDTVEEERIGQSKEFFKVNINLAKKTKDLLAQQKYIEVVKETLEIRKKDLEDRERAINDKYETLTRTITRLKQ